MIKVTAGPNLFPTIGSGTLAISGSGGLKSHKLAANMHCSLTIPLHMALSTNDGALLSIPK